MMMNEMFHFLTAGAALFGIRTLFGNSITKYTVEYLGQRRGDFAAGAIYFISFFYITNKLNKYENKDINYLINAGFSSLTYNPDMQKCTLVRDILVLCFPFPAAAAVVKPRAEVVLLHTKRG